MSPKVQTVEKTENITLESVSHPFWKSSCCSFIGSSLHLLVKASTIRPPDIHEHVLGARSCARLWGYRTRPLKTYNPELGFRPGAGPECSTGIMKDSHLVLHREGFNILAGPGRLRRTLWRTKDILDSDWLQITLEQHRHWRGLARERQDYYNRVVENKGQGQGGGKNDAKDTEFNDH